MTTHHIAGRRLVTSYAPPPIPGWQRMAWCAWDDSLGADASPYRWGATEDEALAALIEEQELPV